MARTVYYYSGNSLLYETDVTSKIVRTVSLTGVVTTIVPAGTLAQPAGLVIYAGTTTNLYVADETNNAIYEFGPLPTYVEIGSPLPALPLRTTPPSA